MLKDYFNVIIQALAILRCYIATPCFLPEEMSEPSFLYPHIRTIVVIEYNQAVKRKGRLVLLPQSYPKSAHLKRFVVTLEQYDYLAC